MVSRPHPGVRFRYNSAITVAAVVTVIAGISLASWATFLLPLLVIPLIVAVWGWRAGTDAAPGGLTVRAALGSRRVAWSDVRSIAPDDKGRVVVHLTSGATLPLPAVTSRDLAQLVAASVGPTQ